jgi:hypothetical protein
MPNGTIIEKGAMDWQIFQQKNGRRDITVAGRLNNGGDAKHLWARIVREDDSSAVTQWIKGEKTAPGRFRCTIPGVPAGGLYRLESCLAATRQEAEWDARGDCVFHICVGDLFVISGQSNAAGYGRTPVYDPPEPCIHLFKTSDRWDMAAHPMNDATNITHEISAEPRIPGHSPWLALAREIRRATGRPVGLLQASKGGTGLWMWHPEDGVYYKNMISVIEKATGGSMEVAGVLWYQGCSDCSEEWADSYYERFEHMAESLRRDMGNSQLPIYTVQINKVLSDAGGMDDGAYWDIVREAQRRAARRIPGVYVVPSLDLALCDHIHNSSAANIALGERMARQILHTLYGQEAFGLPGDIECARVEGPKTLRLKFRNIGYQISALGQLPRDLAFLVEDGAGANTVVGYAIETDAIILELGRETGPDCLVSFAQGRCPSSHLPYDTANGMPLLAFAHFPAACDHAAK